MEMLKYGIVLIIGFYFASKWAEGWDEMEEEIADKVANKIKNNSSSL